MGFKVIAMHCMTESIEDQTNQIYLMHLCINTSNSLLNGRRSLSNLLFEYQRCNNKDHKIRQIINCMIAVTISTMYAK